MKKLISYIKLFLKCYPIAKEKVLSKNNSKYIGTVRTQICYNEVRTELLRKGIADSEVCGSIVYISISLAYLIHIK